MVIYHLIPLSSPMAPLSPLLQKGESKWVACYMFQLNKICSNQTFKKIYICATDKSRFLYFI